VGVTSALIPAGQNLNFAVAAEIVKRLLAGAQPVEKLDALHWPLFLRPEPSVWTSTRDGTDWLVRRLEGTIYSERVAPDALKAKGFSAVCEYHFATADRAWQGVCRVRAPMNCGTEGKVCSFELRDTLDSVRPERITRTAPIIRGINCRTCTVTDFDWTKFVLVPKGPSPPAIQRAQAPKPVERLEASIKGGVVSRSEAAWSFSWALSLTNNEATLLQADATIQFLDADGLVIATAKESGIQVPMGAPVTIRGMTELEPKVAAQVTRLGVKVRAKPL